MKWYGGPNNHPDGLGLYFSDQMGMIMTHKEFYEALPNILDFFENVGDTDIEAHNEAIRHHWNVSLDPNFSPPLTPWLGSGISRTASVTPREVSGYVYFIKEHAAGMIKIGYSRNPIARMKTLSAVLPYQTALLFVIPTDNSRQLEQTLHEHFDAHRRAGEWFQLSDVDLAWVTAQYATLTQDEVPQ